MKRFLVWGAMFGALFTPNKAEAYSWMIRHGYTSCVQCHADPSGGGLLTAYGRAQNELLLQTQYGAPSETGEPSKLSGFLFGLLELPESVLATAKFRGAYLASSSNGGEWNQRGFPMQMDGVAQVALGRFRANASVGVGSETATLPAAIAGRFISRHHWVGATVGEDENGLVRVGRMNLPFGIRNIEHPVWTRWNTKTDINIMQQHGVAFAWSGEHFRTEVMGIAGNFQISPNDYRERGYSGYFEYAPSTKLAVGVSSLVTHTQRDLGTLLPTWRHAHGVFGRWSPVMPLVLSLEADALLTSPVDAERKWGHVALAQADWEILQGLHLIGTGETVRARQNGEERPSWGSWASVAWFFGWHSDLRIDYRRRWSPGFTGRSTSDLVLVQFHTFL